MDATGFFPDFHLEIPGRTFNGLQICIRDQLDVQVPADLDQLGGDDSHGAIIGWKGFVQLGHDAPDGG